MAVRPAPWYAAQVLTNARQQCMNGPIRLHRISSHRITPDAVIEVQPHFHAFMPCELPEVLPMKPGISDSAGGDARNSPSSPNGLEFSYVSRVSFFTKLTYFQNAWAYLPKLTELRSVFVSFKMCLCLDPCNAACSRQRWKTNFFTNYYIAGAMRY